MPPKEMLYNSATFTAVAGQARPFAPAKRLMEAFMTKREFLTAGVGAGLALVQKAGAGVPVALIGAFPLGVGAFVAVAYGWARRRSLPQPVPPEPSAAADAV